MTWSITKTVFAVCMGLGCVLQLSAANLLVDANVDWGVRLLDQGMGSIERNSNGSGYSINKDSEIGAVCLAAEKQIPIQSGKSYELAVKLKTGGAAKASIMLSIAIDGGKRRYLQTVPISTADKFILQKKSFVAQKGETEAAIVIVVAGGIGAVEVESVDFQEKTQVKE